MVNKRIRLLSLVFLLSILWGCDQTKEVISWSEYQDWLQSEEDLRRTKSVNNINISAQFFPSNYLAYKQLLSSDMEIDSLSFAQSNLNYKCGLTFKILVEPDESGINLLYHKVSGEVDYKSRVNALSFKGDEYIKMKIGRREYSPVLVSYEGYNEMVNRLVFTTVFQPEEYSCGAFHSSVDHLSVTFDDPFWSTGKNHFSFSISALIQVPEIILN